jgi:hypothetical protein
MSLQGTSWVQLVSARVRDNVPIPIRMVIFFASNPEVELSAKEIASKWALSRSDARRKGRKLAEQGFLTVEHRAGPVAQKSAFYRAGPVIRAELGYDSMPLKGGYATAIAWAGDRA